MMLLNIFSGLDAVEWVLVGLMGVVALLIIFGIFTAIDNWLGHWEESSGKIEGELYTPEINSTGTGVGTNGQLVVTSSHSPEAWHVVVREDVTNIVVKLDCTMQYQYDVKPGDKVKFRKKYGKFSKDWLRSELID